MAASQLYASLSANWDTAISTAVSQTVANSIAANATLLGSSLTLYIIISGLLTCFGRMSMSEWVFGATRAGIISALLVTATFNQQIQTPLMTTIPNWIASSVNGNVGAQTGPQQFDAVRNSVVAIEAEILQQATGWTQVGERARADLATWFICLEITVSYIIWEMNRCLMGLLIAAAPFLLGFYLFQSTRHIVTNLAGAAVTVLILLLLVSILMAMSINADQQWLANSRAPTATIEVQLDNMKNIAFFFLFGMVMTIFLPALAARIGHGVLPSLSPLVSSPLRMIDGATRSLGRRIRRR